MHSYIRDSDPFEFLISTKMIFQKQMWSCEQMVVSNGSLQWQVPKSSKNQKKSWSNTTGIWPKIIKIWNHTKALFRSSCTMDVSLFPFDRQNCTLIFSSSTYDARDLEFIGASPVTIDAGAFTRNSEWRLDGCPGHLSIRPGFNPYQMHFSTYFVSIDPLWPHFEPQEKRNRAWRIISSSGFYFLFDSASAILYSQHYYPDYFNVRFIHWCILSSRWFWRKNDTFNFCLLYTSDAADE